MMRIVAVICIEVATLVSATLAQQPAPRPATTPRPPARTTRGRQPALPPTVRWLAVSGGISHTCALDITGQAYCWGDNAWHRLGVSDSVNIRRPVRVETPQRFRLIAAGASETCAVTERGGGIVCWGGQYPGTLPRTVLADRTYDRIAIKSNTCAISTDGNGWCWGANGTGQLGSGSPSYEFAATPQPLAGGRKWRAVEPGFGGFSCGLTDGGTAMCWGSNASGQLGTGSERGSRVPEVVLDAPNYQTLAVGGEHTCGLVADGSAWCWGNGLNGALGNGRRGVTRAPQRVSGTQHWTQLVAGYDFTCGLDDAGKAWCWGKNHAGVLGTGNRTDSDVPVAVRTTQVFTTLSAGNSHVCGVSNQQLFCWGDNADGQLGLARTQTCRTTVAPGQTDVRQCAMVPTRVQEPR
jgi:alpha-tubulin suppressor-like RCC1 family protein